MTFILPSISKINKLVPLGSGIQLKPHCKKLLQTFVLTLLI